MKDFDIKKFLAEGNLLKEDKKGIELFVGETLEEFTNFVETLTDQLEANYDNAFDLGELEDRKEKMWDSINDYIEFLVVIDGKTDDLENDDGDLPLDKQSDY